MTVCIDFPLIWIIFTHVISGYTNFMEQKEFFAEKRV